MSSLASASSAFAPGAVRNEKRNAKRQGGRNKQAAGVVARAKEDRDGDEPADFRNDLELRQKLVSGVAAASLLANVFLSPVALAADAIAEVYQTAQPTDLPAQVRPEFPRFENAVPLSGPIADIADLSLDELYASNKAKQTARDEIFAKAARSVQTPKRDAVEKGGDWRYRAPDAPALSPAAAKRAELAVEKQQDVETAAEARKASAETASAERAAAQARAAAEALAPIHI